MDNISTEVGQKMKSAVKAKLMELGCYVDDELPEYIMVMVGNKRTKSQMKQDLDLFLNTKTSTFVDWLHIVLKKLEEITVTNPLVLKRISKRKLDDNIKGVKMKKEKKTKLCKKSKKKVSLIANIKSESALTKSPETAKNKLAEVRKIVVIKEGDGTNSILNEENVIEDNFDIPTLSQVSNEAELAETEKKIKGIRSRLGIQIVSGSEDDDYINLKADPDDLFPMDGPIKETTLKDVILQKIKMLNSSTSPEQLHNTYSSEVHSPEQSNKEKDDHRRILFEGEDSGTPVKRTSVLERLGKKLDTTDLKRKRVNLMESRKEEEESLGVTKIIRTEDSNTICEDSSYEEREIKKLKNADTPKESALKRLGLKSTIAIPHKEVGHTNSEEEAENLLSKEVPSTVKVKPRMVLPPNKQANKNLLLKAVAEAQKSVTQTPVVGSNKSAIYTKKYREKMNNLQTSARKISIKDKNNLRNMVTNAVKQDNKEELNFSSDDDNLLYIPKPVKRALKSNDHPEYIPSSRDYSSDDCDNLEAANVHTFPKQTKNQTFIITLDGISRNHDAKSALCSVKIGTNEKHKKKAPSPIIFDSHTSPVTSRTSTVPDRLPSVTSQSSIKTKERCKFWPSCRQGEKCEFIHPNTSCRAFPQCKFGDKCLYIHPTCKFETSCTRKDCPYNHAVRTPFINSKTPQLCKFYPNCSNIHCSFYHPRPCKYGKNCKNPQHCTFSHTFPSKGSLTWRSTLKS